MKSYIRSLIQRFNANKLIVGFIIVASVTVLGTTSVVGAAPDYFSVAKPSPTSQCYGGQWQPVHQWRWWHSYNFRVWVPNWQKLGFESQGQCIRYTSTNAPTSKHQCESRWRQLGFSSRRDCERYLRMHPGNGYGGDGDSENNR